MVLGLVTTKTNHLETLTELRRRISDASRYILLGQLGLSPQCGFSSSIVGNNISAETQRKKLELVVETAHEVWG